MICAQSVLLTGLAAPSHRLLKHSILSLVVEQGLVHHTPVMGLLHDRAAVEDHQVLEPFGIVYIVLNVAYIDRRGIKQFLGAPDRHLLFDLVRDHRQIHVH